MSVVLEPENSGPAATRLDWMLVLAGLLVLYAPTFYDLAAWHWQRDEGGHGPIVLAVVVWLIWRRRAALFSPSTPAAPVPGFALLAFGLLLYVLGRSQEITLLQIAALLPVLAGVLLAMRGRAVLRSFLFPIFFTAFMMPLPGMFVDAVTGPLKQSVSQVAEHLLYTGGYPVARSGVVLSIGQYQLLVADACSGLHSMISLSALGVLFMYLTARASLLHNAIMLASILPIAFFANIVRVLLLLLITYHFGNAAGQGFLHGATGIVLLLVALIVLMALDALLVRILRPHRPA